MTLTLNNNWATWEAGLPAVIAACLGLSTSAVAWAESPRSMITGPRAQISVLSTLHHGTDDMRRTLASGQLTEETLGQRTLVLQVRVWTPGQTLAESARVYAERLRTRLHWTRIEELLRALDLGFLRAEQPVDLDADPNGRIETSSVVDVFLSYAWVEADTEAGAALDYIDQVLIDGDKVRDVNDDPIDDALQPSIDVQGS